MMEYLLKLYFGFLNGYNMIWVILNVGCIIYSQNGWVNLLVIDVCDIHIIINGGMANSNICEHFPCLYDSSNEIRKVLLQNKNSNVSMIIVKWW